MVKEITIFHLLISEYMYHSCMTDLSASTVADLEGVQGVRSNPLLEPNYFIFMENSRHFV